MVGWVWRKPTTALVNVLISAALRGDARTSETTAVRSALSCVGSACASRSWKRVLRSLLRPVVRRPAMVFPSCFFTGAQSAARAGCDDVPRRANRPRVRANRAVGEERAALGAVALKKTAGEIPPAASSGCPSAASRRGSRQARKRASRGVVSPGVSVIAYCGRGGQFAPAKLVQLASPSSSVCRTPQRVHKRASEAAVPCPTPLPAATAAR